MISTQRVSIEHSSEATRPPYAAIDVPRVMVVGTDSGEVRFIQRVLEVAGYWVDSRTISPQSVTTSRAALKGLFGTCSIEFLVLDGAGEPEVAAQLLDLIRQFSSDLPIVLIAGPDAALRREAKRVAVDIVIDAPATIAALRRAARELAPLFPEPRADDGEPKSTSRWEPPYLRCS
jgi:hypothetical protein